ncbi:MAG TPA: hypothetical protein VF103_18525 [Polyangiaceae bacterium]
MTDIALTELASLIVQNDFLRGEVDDQNLRAAREAERRAQEQEIAAMHDAADAVVTGAWVEGLTAAAAGGAQCYASLARIGVESDDERTALDAIDKGGKGLAGIAGPAGALTGDAPKASAEAEAAQARNAAERADASADEAERHHDRVERHTDQVLDAVEGTLNSEHQGNFAILGNF